MPYEVFFSYRRSDYGPHLRVFLEDLSEEVRKLRGLDRSADISFFDQQDIETGDNWDAVLSAALQQSKVLVPIYSRAYFKSEYCGREWAVFQARREACALQNGGAQPPVIRPIIWLPFFSGSPCLPGNVDPAVRRVQFTWKEEQSELNQQGLEHLVRRKSVRESEYWDFLRGFAAELVHVIENVDLPELPLQPLEQIRSAFDPQATLQGPAAGGRRLRPHVRFIFAALAPHEVGEGRAREAYQEFGGSDWKPFFPVLNRRIGALAAHFVSDAPLELDSDSVEWTDDLAGAVRTARDQGRLAVVFVDRWSLRVSERYRKALLEFDQENFFNCAVLLPWNPEDPELVPLRRQLQTAAEEALPFHHKQYSPSSPYFCRTVSSQEELRAALQSVLLQIQGEMRRQAPLRRPLASTFARPILTGPGA